MEPTPYPTNSTDAGFRMLLSSALLRCFPFTCVLWSIYSPPSSPFCSLNHLAHSHKVICFQRQSYWSLIFRPFVLCHQLIFLFRRGISRNLAFGYCVFHQLRFGAARLLPLCCSDYSPARRKVRQRNSPSPSHNQGQNATLSQSLSRLRLAPRPALAIGAFPTPPYL